MTTLNLNQFKLSPVVGEAALGTYAGQTISAMVSLSQATGLTAGQFVKLDTPAGTKVPSVVEVAYNADGAIGTILYDTRKGTKVAGDACQLLISAGPVVYLKAGDTINAGQSVETNVDGDMIPYSAGKKRGIALDPAVSGDIFRVILITPVA